MSFRTDAVPEPVKKLLVRAPSLLKEIPGAYLAGGTALSLYLGHRVSIDLDFFTQDDFEVEPFYQELTKAGSAILLRTAINTLICRILDVQFSLFKYPYPLLDPVELFSEVRVASLRDIACMKVVAISQRGTRKDFYDLHALLKNTSLQVERILEDVLSKYGQPKDSMYHYIRSLAFFEDAQKEPDIQPLLTTKILWGEIETFFGNLARHLLP